MDLKLIQRDPTVLHYNLLVPRVRWIAQHNVHRRELDPPDLESNEEIFQHKMQAYDKVVFTPPTPRGARVQLSASRICVRKLLSVLMGESIYKIAGTSLS